METWIAIAGLVLTALDFIGTMALTLFVMWMNKQQRELREWKRKSENLESDMRHAAQSMLKTELTAIEARGELKINGSLAAMNTQITEMRTMITMFGERFHAGDGHFKSLDEKHHQLEVKVLEALNSLKDVVATKDDLRQMREDMNRG